MFLFGCKSIHATAHITEQELSYQPYLLMFVLLGFSTLQAQGNMVLRLYDSFSDFTMSVLCLLHYSFEKLYVCKPFATKSPYKANYYVVC